MNENKESKSNREENVQITDDQQVIEHDAETTVEAPMDVRKEVVNETDLTDTDLFDDEMEEDKGSSLVYKLVWGGFGLCIVVSLILGGYFFPFSQKLTGTWQTDEGVSYKLVSKGDKFSMESPTDTTGVTFVYRGKWQGVGPNKYEGREIVVQVAIDKAVLSKEEIEGFEKDSTVYSIVSNTDKELVVQYSEKSAKTLLDTDDFSDLFQYTLTKFKGIGGKEALEWNSSHFSEELMYLYPQSDE